MGRIENGEYFRCSENYFGANFWPKRTQNSLSDNGVQRTKFLVNMFFGRSSNDVIGEKSNENSVLRPTKVATNKVVESESRNGVCVGNL